MQVRELYGRYVSILTAAGWVFTLVLRVLVGKTFLQAGWGKLQNIDKPTQFFAELGIPMPEFNAYLVGVTECVGGLLFIVGLGTRLVSVPLAITMIVALFTAHRSEWSEEGKTFLDASIAVYLLTFLWCLFHGPGKLSLDAIVARVLRSKHDPATTPNRE
jgi:putative oxidoreductase